MYLIKKIVHFYWIGSAFLMITIQGKTGTSTYNVKKHDGRTRNIIYKKTKQKNMIT